MSEEKSNPIDDSGDSRPDTHGEYLRSKYIAPTTIKARQLASDTPPVMPLSPASRLKSSPTPPGTPTPFKKKRRSLRTYCEIAAGVALAGALVFLLLPKSWVNRSDTLPAVPESGPEETAPVTPALAATLPPPVDEAFKTPAEWVEKVPIGGVRASKIIIAGKVYDREAPIPPFNLRWTGRSGDTLTFVNADGAVFTRRYAN